MLNLSTDTESGRLGGHVLFVHAHPDDETLVTGGTLASLARRAEPFTVVTCTRGEAGEVIPADLAHLGGDGDALAAHREGELAEAMRILGVRDHRWLGEPGARMAGREPRRYRDSGMAWGANGPIPAPDVPADSLCAAELGEVAADIATVISTTGAAAVIGYDAHGGYGHPDHIVAQLAARRAAEVMGVPYFAIQTGPVTDAADTTVDVTPVLELKRAALRAYRSQLTVEGDRLTMPGGQTEPIGLVEHYRRVDAHDDRREREEPPEWRDRSIGGRVAAVAFALLGGVALGAIGTVVFQSGIDVLGIRIPLGLIVSLLVIAALLAGLRLVAGTRVVAAAASAGLLGSIAVLSMESPGGSVLVPAIPLSYFWVYGPPLIALVVLAWPGRARAGRRQPGGSDLAG